MVHRVGVGLTLWALLPLWLASTAFANDQQSIISLNSHGPETRVVSNATDLGEALQAHEVTNIIIKGNNTALNGFMHLRFCILLIEAIPARSSVALQCHCCRHGSLAWLAQPSMQRTTT